MPVTCPVGACHKRSDERGRLTSNLLLVLQCCGRSELGWHIGREKIRKTSGLGVCSGERQDRTRDMRRRGCK